MNRQQVLQLCYFTFLLLLYEQKKFLTNKTLQLPLEVALDLLQLCNLLIHFQRGSETSQFNAIMA